MYGKEAFKLVNELELTSDIRPFNDVVFDQVLNEINTLYKANAEDIEEMQRGNAVPLTTIQFRHVAINRNKRCLLVYLYHRMRRLRQMRWEIGSVLPSEVTANLIQPELQWIYSYNRFLATYMRSIGENGFNIMKDVIPPKSLYIEVRCLVDYGKFEFENGQVITLKKNTHHLLPRDQCESLVRQGILEHINS